MSEVRAERTYGNWRVPRSPGILGLDLMGSGVLVGGLLVVILTVAAVGLLAAIVVLLIQGGLLASMMVRNRHGQNGLQRLFIRVAWRQTRSQGANHYRSGPLGRSRWGSFQLPGLLASTKLHQYADAWGQPFAVLELPTRGHYAVVFNVEPEGSSLVDQEQQDQWVARFGGVLNHLSDEPGVIACQVTIESVPDTGRALHDYVERRIDAQAPAIAQDVLRELGRSYPSGAAQVKAWVSLTFSSEVHSRRMDVDEFAAELKPRLRGIGEQFHGTGVGGSHPLSAQQLCELVRSAYDPAAAAAIEENNLHGVTTPLSWDNVGPAATEASWDSYRHDGAVSVTWAMTIAPRGEVHSNILARLLAPSRQVARKRVTMVYRVIDAGLAARQVEADKRSADFRVLSSKRPAEQALAEQRMAALTAQEEARGAGLVDFSMLVTATVDGDSLEQQKIAEATVQNLAATARVALRRVYGSQDSAFAGALPLGLVLPEYLRVPKLVRKASA
jgi:hypothetical protein